MATTQCRECNPNTKVGHNFCRNCGNKLTLAGIKRLRIMERYQGYEKFCGYCGIHRRECSCDVRGRR